jgi:hypothetical protein
MNGITCRLSVYGNKRKWIFLLEGDLVSRSRKELEILRGGAAGDLTGRWGPPKGAVGWGRVATAPAP